jgi:hypothetical protein
MLRKVILSLIMVVVVLVCQVQAASMYAIMKIQGGSPVWPEEATWHGAVLYAQKGNYGLYKISGSAAQLLALANDAKVWPIGNAKQLDSVITDAARTKLNAALVDLGYPTIPSGWSLQQVLTAVGKKFTTDSVWSERLCGINDPEE